MYLRAISRYKPLEGLYLEGRFNGGFFALRVWGAYIWRGLYTWRGLFSEFYGMCHPKGRVFAPFWSKDFVLFGLESGMVFKGTTVGYERIYSNSKWILRNLFCCCSNLRNEDINSKRPGLSMDFRGQTV